MRALTILLFFFCLHIFKVLALFRDHIFCGICSTPSQCRHPTVHYVGSIYMTDQDPTIFVGKTIPNHPSHQFIARVKAQILACLTFHFLFGGLNFDTPISLTPSLSSQSQNSTLPLLLLTCTQSLIIFVFCQTIISEFVIVKQQ